MTVDLFADLTDDERAALADLARELLAARPGPMPLHVVRDEVRRLQMQLGSIEQSSKPLREQITRLEAQRDSAAKEKVNEWGAGPKAVRVRQLGSLILGVSDQLRDAEMRAAPLRAQLDQLAPDALRFDDEWKRAQPQHDKARSDLLRRLVADAETGVKAAQKTAQKASTPAELRAAADTLEQALAVLERVTKRLDGLGRVGVRDWR